MEVEQWRGLLRGGKSGGGFTVCLNLPDVDHNRVVIASRLVCSAYLVGGLRLSSLVVGTCSQSKLLQLHIVPSRSQAFGRYA